MRKNKPLSVEWTPLVLAHQADMLELPFATSDVWVDECLYSAGQNYLPP